MKTTRLGLLAILVLTYSAQSLAEKDLVPDGILSLPNGEFYKPHAVIVDKDARKTTVWTREDGKFRKVTEYTSDQGKRDGDKVKLGDHKTPEGIYFFQDMYEGQNLNFELYGIRAFTTDYPNLFDRREGKTGSGIWLHAIPDTQSLERGSRGCVVIRNRDIIEISQYINLQRTPIIIEDSVNMVSREERQKQRQRIYDFIAEWKNAWQKKDMENYMKAYSKENFRSRRMNWEKWKAYKAFLNKKYETIRVDFSRPMILKHNNEYIVRVLQRYESDKHLDFGEKTLYLKDEKEGLKIIAEDWVATNKSIATEQFEADVGFSVSQVSSIETPEAERISRN